MSLSISKLSDIQISQPTFTCDQYILNPKLDEHEALSNFNRKTHFIIINGKAGSGKTSIMLDMILRKKPRIYRKNVHKIFFFCPESSLSSIEGNPINEESVSHLYHDLTPDILEGAIEQAKEYGTQGLKSLFVFDDFAAIYKDHMIEQALKRLIYNRRHMGVIGIIMLTQIFYAIPLSLRRASTMMYLYKPTNRKESKAIMDEITGITPKQWDTLVQHVYSDTAEKRNFMLFVPDTGKIFKNYSESIALSEE